ncbi:MAG: MFS transporter, partial [Herbiconiux sp.]|nr:MFS transporter [Herbiconiux sp.]
MTRSSYPVVDVLRTRNTGYLLLTSLLGRLPGAMAALAIVQLVRSTSGDFGFAGLVTAVYVVAGAVGQPLLGRLIDRVGQVAVLAVSGILSFLAFTGMALTLEPLPGAAVALAAAAGVFTPPLEPA